MTLLRASPVLVLYEPVLRNTMNSWFERLSQRSMFSTSRFEFLPIRRWGPYSFCNKIRTVGWGWKFWKREFSCRLCHLLQHSSMFCLDLTLVIESNSCWWVWMEEAIEEEGFSSCFNVQHSYFSRASYQHVTSGCENCLTPRNSQRTFTLYSAFLGSFLEKFWHGFSSLKG